MTAARIIVPLAGRSLSLSPIGLRPLFSLRPSRSFQHWPSGAPARAASPRPFLPASPNYIRTLRTRSKRAPDTLTATAPRKDWPLPPPALSDVGKKLLVLDLDETLVHSKIVAAPADLDEKIVAEVMDRWNSSGNAAVFLLPDDDDCEGKSVSAAVRELALVRKRPGLSDFLRRIGDRFEVVVFTAGMRVYADPTLDAIDKGGVIRHRLFRDSCNDGDYAKDLTRLGRDLKDVIIVDNSPWAFRLQPENAILIESWYDDPNDTALGQVAPFLEELAAAEDVRTALAGQLEKVLLELSIGWARQADDEDGKVPAMARDCECDCGGFKAACHPLSPQEAQRAAKAAAGAAKDMMHPNSNYPFYSQTLANSLGARSPMAQYTFYAALLGGLGFTGRQFYRSHHLLKAVRFKPQTKEYIHHLHQANASEVDAADAIKVAENWRMSGLMYGCGPPALILAFLLMTKGH
ncbi:CTD (Carboxy-terminal domain, RNA polymerase II, polypeptide A) small [Irineochytrium annulatum]|nr:CTD (Carboxy-terminal domain, RNA polymerase II, polypeptide A) small [Irineochytrium annulatum]